MSYQKRRHFDGVVYRVTAEAASGLRLFNDEFDHASFMSIMIKYKAQLGFRVYAYAFLPERIQLVIGARKTSVSEIMHRILMVYSKRYNKRYRLKGHVFAERHSQEICVEKDAFIRAVDAVHRLPVGLPGVWREADWFWSGASEWCRDRRLLLLDDVEVEKAQGKIKIDPYLREFLIFMLTRNAGRLVHRTMLGMPYPSG